MAREYGLFFSSDAGLIDCVAHFCATAKLRLERAHEYQWRYSVDDGPHTTVEGMAYTPQDDLILMYANRHAYSVANSGHNRYLALSDSKQDGWEAALQRTLIAYANQTTDDFYVVTVRHVLLIQRDGQLQVNRDVPLQGLKQLTKPYTLVEMPLR